MNHLILNNKTYHLPQLTVDVPDQAGLSDYERRVLAFCREWLSGREAFVVQTSGSTGRPKPISLTRQQMMASAAQTGRALGLQAGDRALVCLSADYIAGRMMLVRGFTLGLQLTIIDPSGNPLQMFSPQSNFDFTAMVPLQLQNILTETPDKVALLDRMKGILIGGAAVSLALQAQLQQVRGPIYHTYGMTETVSHIALRRLNGPQADQAFVPFPGVALGLDGRGCLTIRAAVTNQQTVVTNDLVQLQPDGSFVWLGRVDNVINSGGVKVQVERVERALEQFLLNRQRGRADQADGAERRFFVGPLADPQWGQAVVAVIEGRPFEREAALAEAMRAELSGTLSRYELPKAVHFVAQFAETPTGKVDRQATLQRLRAG